MNLNHGKRCQEEVTPPGEPSSSLLCHCWQLIGENWSSFQLSQLLSFTWIIRGNETTTQPLSFALC